MDAKTLVRKIVAHPEMGEKLLTMFQEDIFVRGQLSGRSLEKRISLYNSKKLSERERRHKDLRDDFFNFFVEELKLNLPCNRLKAPCQWKIQMLTSIDRFRDSLFEKISTRIKESEEGLEQGKLFEL